VHADNINSSITINIIITSNITQHLIACIPGKHGSVGHPIYFLCCVGAQAKGRQAQFIKHNSLRWPYNTTR